MPDPRDPGQQHPPDRTGWEQPRAPEPEWPEPAWRERDFPPPVQNFNRERFLLRCVAWILGVQFGIFILAGGVCSYGYYVKANKVTSATDQLKVCPEIADKIGIAAGDSLAILLALLGGGTLAAAEYQRRQKPDPRERDRLPPPR